MHNWILNGLLMTLAGASNNIAAVFYTHIYKYIIHTKSGGKLWKNQALLPLLVEPFWGEKCDFSEFVKKNYKFQKLHVTNFNLFL